MLEFFSLHSACFYIVSHKANRDRPTDKKDRSLVIGTVHNLSVRNVHTTHPCKYVPLCQLNNFSSFMACNSLELSKDFQLTKYTVSFEI